jgi:hypothetical protein
VLPTADTYLTVWAADEPRPPVSNLNPARRQIVPNAAITGLGLPDRRFNVYNNAGTTDVVIDVVGSFYFLFVPPPTGPSAISGAKAGKPSFVRPAPRPFTLHRVT